MFVEANFCHQKRMEGGRLSIPLGIVPSKVLQK